ncbi:serine hydrolase domain-containing protein [Sphingomicrobium sp. XHP0235]|uniref:serine hydrolase domain-containing protein n=1 Tax=Sphingomicrobium aquimarinum TaxID=3133971 RepID=UPI0031FE80CF
MNLALPLLLFACVVGGAKVLGAEPAAVEEEETSAVVRAPLAPVQAAERESIDFIAMDARLHRLMDEHGPMVAMAVGVVVDGEIAFLKGYGETEVEEGDPVDIDTIFRWASVSKGVAGTMAAKLDAEGELSLDAPIAQYAASLRLPDNNQFTATLRDTLSHRLGLWRNAYDDRLEEGQDPRQIRQQLGELSQVCPIGTCWSYQNVAFDASSEAIEKVTGQTYDTVLKERLFGPLGMTHASATRDGLVEAKRWAHPFNRGGREYEVDQHYYGVPAAGGINSSILDAGLWLKAQLGGMPNIVSPEMLEEAHRPLIETPGEMRRMRNYRERLSDARYGLGWRTYEYAGHTIVGHRGGVDGYRSFILMDPARKSGIVAFWNSDTGQPHGLQFEFLDMLYGLEKRDWLELGEAGA